MRTIIVAFLLLNTFSCSSLLKNPSPQIKLITKLSSNKSTFKLDEPIEIIMKIQNIGKKKYTFLPWGTPIENILTRDCLKIMYGNNSIDYSGIMVKRKAPTKSDYITLSTGEIANGKINILEGYKLDKKGEYTIQFKETFDGIPFSNTITIVIK